MSTGTGTVLALMKANRAALIEPHDMHEVFQAADLDLQAVTEWVGAVLEQWAEMANGRDGGEWRERFTSALSMLAIGIELGRMPLSEREVRCKRCGRLDPPPGLLSADDFSVICGDCTTPDDQRRTTDARWPTP